MINVRAAVGNGVGGFAVQTIGLDAPRAGEVLIALRASGVCHTDWDSLRWGRPLILGHEGAGIVQGVGDGVTSCRPGGQSPSQLGDSPVASASNAGLAMKTFAKTGALCPMLAFTSLPQPRAAPSLTVQSATITPASSTGSAGPGAFNASFSLGTMATHAVVPQAAVLSLPEDVPFDVGAILGCAVMTGFGSAVNAAKVQPGSTVVVLGCGGVGLSTILGARYCGAALILAIDINPTRLELALQFGATDTLLADRDDHGLLAAAGEVKRRVAGRGADYAFECTAVPELGPAPLAMIRNAGTAVAVSGIEQVVPVDMELFEWDKLYINPLYGSCRPQRDFPLLLDLYRRGELPLQAMVTRRYPLDELDQAFKDMHAGTNAKGVLVFD